MANVSQSLKMEPGQFELFEICQDIRLGYCRVLRCLSDLISQHGDKTIKELKESSDTFQDVITHQSTWVLITKEKNEGLINAMKEAKGAMLMRLLIRMFGNDEFEIKAMDTVKIS